MKSRVDLHSHTIASGHAYNTLMEMTAEAAEKGLEMYGITDHAPSIPGSCSELYFINFRAVDRSVFPLELLLGVELNIVNFDGKVDLRTSILKKQDVTIASIHKPCIKQGNKEDYTRAVIKAMENPLINIIGHPDDERFPVDYEAITTAAKETGTLLELNNSSLTEGAPRQNARENDITMLKLCAKKNIPIVMGSDAHFYTQVGDHTLAQEIIKEADFPEELVLNYYPDKLRKYLNKYKQ